MRYKPKNIKSAVLIIVIVLALIAASYFFGFGTLRSATRIGYVGNEGLQSWSGRYALLSGTMRHTLRPDGDTLTVAVETQSGEISIEIKDAEGKLLFDEDNIGTETFDVAVSGKAVVLIEADSHKGSFDISCK